MIRRTRLPSEALRRILENAALLAFTSLLVMSVVLGRYAGALLWGGALTVFFVHAWEGRSHVFDAADGLPRQLLRARRYDSLRWLGLALAFVGAAAAAC